MQLLPLDDEEILQLEIMYINEIERVKEKDVNKSVTSDKRPFIHTIIANQDLLWLVDTGAAICVISLDNMNCLFPSVSLKHNAGPTVSSATGHPFTTLGKFLMPISVQGKEYSHPVVVVDHLASGAILGIDFLKAAGAVIDVANDVISFGSTIVSCSKTQATGEAVHSAQPQDSTASRAEDKRRRRRSSNTGTVQAVPATVRKKRIIPGNCSALVQIRRSHSSPDGTYLCVGRMSQLE